MDCFETAIYQCILRTGKLRRTEYIVFRYDDTVVAEVAGIDGYY